MGIVEGVRPVKLEGTKSPIGTVAGAAIGGVAGSTVGSGKGSGIAAVIGAVAGGLAGSAAEEGLTRKQGVEVTLKMDNGELLAIVQEDGGENFKPGERVPPASGRPQYPGDPLGAPANPWGLTAPF